ncbi:hypothetical protein C8Q78DRAFT_414184 [Trametes maxima]|nr:hypothetical protein C8Q78DRAFT_414184 [Trametes maxima]
MTHAPRRCFQAPTPQADDRPGEHGTHRCLLGASTRRIAVGKHRCRPCHARPVHSTGNGMLSGWRLVAPTDAFRVAQLPQPSSSEPGAPVPAAHSGPRELPGRSWSQDCLLASADVA